MSSVIIELQKEIILPGKKVSDILRKAYIIARKLKITEFEKWILNELHGYKENNIPDYRIMYGEIRGWNSFRGWIPVIITNPQEQKKITKYANWQGIPELEYLLENDKTKKNGIHVLYCLC